MDALFDNRKQAGHRLAQALAMYRESHPVVLALPRGGVPVAFEVARKLAAPLDVMLVRKIGVPWQPELALAAVVGGAPPVTVLNDALSRLIPVPREYLRDQEAFQLEEIERRRRKYLGQRAPLELAGRVAIVVDDGIATGTTMRAVLKALRRMRPARVVLAVPVAPPETLAALRGLADEVVCLYAPAEFRAVGTYYRHFQPVGDDEVADLLGRAAIAADTGVPPTDADEVVEQVRAALLADERLDLAHHALALSFADGSLIIDGEVGSVAAKRLAIECGATVPGVERVIDQLRLIPQRPESDRELAGELGQALAGEPALAANGLLLSGRGWAEPVRSGGEGMIEVRAEGGIVTLRGQVASHQARRLAGVLAWRAEGTRDVINHLAVAGAIADSDEAVAEAVRYSLGHHPRLRPERLAVSADHGVVTLRGEVDDLDQLIQAEADAWLVDGVGQVVNAIAVRSAY